MRTRFVIVFILGILITQAGHEGDFNYHDSALWGAATRPTSQFNRAQMEPYFRRILANADPNTNVTHIEAMDSDESEPLIEIGRDELNYDIWRRQFSKFEAKIPPMAELFAIGKNAAMRVRDDHGNVTKTVLQGSDPYILHACGTDLSVVHLGIYQPLREPEYKSHYVALEFFLMASRDPDEELTRCVLEYLIHTTHSSDLSVSIRTDPWFIDEFLFPVVSPFLPEVKPPSKDEWQSAPRWECGAMKTYSEVVCWGHGRLSTISR